MNWFGFLIGIATLFIIGLGFVWVIRGEYYFGPYWWPYTLGLGLLLILGSLLITSNWGSALTGVTGASLVWGSTEFREQAVRGEIGWYPFNPRRKPDPPFGATIKKWPLPHL